MRSGTGFTRIPETGDPGTEIWCLSTEINSAGFQYAISQLSESEKIRAAKFKHEGAKLQYVLAHAALRILLKRHLDERFAQLRFKTTEYHKPFVALPDGSRPLEFNLSHCFQWIAIAFGPHPVGIDIEAHRPMDDMKGVAEIVFTQKEQTTIFAENTSENAELFFRHWSCKEAFLKAGGSGFMKDPKTIELDFGSRTGEERPVVYWSDAIPGHSLAWTQQRN